jgi:Tol biopolymer transport system component
MSRGPKCAVGAISIAFLLSLPAAAPAVFPGENGKIAFVSGMGAAANDDSSSDVYILDGPGDITPTQVTFAAGQHRHPAWSPDLKTLAYARWVNCDPMTRQCTDEKIFLDDLSDPGPVNERIGPHASNVKDDRPAWNPKGNKIAYESEVTDNPGGPPLQMDILITNIKTGATINLTSTPSITEGKPVWSADGKTIFYSRDNDIVSEPSDNSSNSPSLVTNSAVEEYQPALSPDQTAMCFTRGPFGSPNADVFTITPVALGGTQTDLSDSTVGAYNCAWSPESDKIAFVEGVFTNGALKMKNSDDTGVSTLVTTDTAQHFDGNPDWAPKRPAFCEGKPATIAGTDQKDDLEGTNERDVIQGHGARDSIEGRRGKDRECGRGGRDRLEGGKDNDKLFGGGDDDLLIGGKGIDACDGGGGDDTKIGCEK